jgi:hypothetical protein
MSELQPPYEPSTRFEQQNGLYGNHFRFTLEALPDLTFFAQAITIPSITSGPVNRATPFTSIREVGDHLNYSNFTVSYLIDGAFKTYSSLYWWLKGYGFPHSYDEVLSFRETRAKRVAMPNPQVKDLEKTSASLLVLQPDTEKIIAEFQFIDVVPTGLSDLQFGTMEHDAPVLKATVTFECTAFELMLT